MSAAEFSITIRVTMDNVTLPSSAQMSAIGEQIAAAAMHHRADYEALLHVASLVGGDIIAHTGQPSE
jgi:hypothetical protein